MVAAFLICNYLLKKDIAVYGFDPMIGEDITFRAAIGGIIGAKAYYLIENIPTGQAANNLNGLLDIISGIFTGHLLNTKCCRNKKTYFDDKDNWDLEEEVVMIGA